MGFLKRYHLDAHQEHGVRAMHFLKGQQQRLCQNVDINKKTTPNGHLMDVFFEEKSRGVAAACVEQRKRGLCDEVNRQG